MRKSTRSASTNKPDKPYDGFPLFPHASGRWAKKVGGKLCYFGRWGNKVGSEIVPVEDVRGSADKALAELNRQWPFLSEGVEAPAADNDGCTIQSLCNAFWDFKLAKVEAGELSHRSYGDYESTCQGIISHFGKSRRVDTLQPGDFDRLRKKLTERLGPVALKNEINRIRSVFKFAFDQGLIEKPVRYGQSFNRPSLKSIRKARNEAGSRMFEASELRTILQALEGKPTPVTGIEEPVTLTPDPQMRAMVLLGLNCGFGNTDVSTLPQSAVSLETAWIDFPRPKTEIHRRCPLWPETVEAIKAAVAVRPGPASAELADNCFLTRTGERFVRIDTYADDADKVRPVNYLSQKFAKVLKALKINGRRGLGFYTLRHVFETIGGESKDQVAVDAVMGHADHSMAGHYRERISDERLRAVADTIHAWLWPVESDETETA